MSRLLEKAALVIIDAQKGFMDSVINSEETIERISKVLESARKAQIPIVFTQEKHRKEMVDFGRELDGAEDIHCLEGTEDIEIVDLLRPVDGEFFIAKRRYSCFFSTDLDLLLRGLGVDTIIVCGFLTNVCVHYTCVDAHQYNYRLKVVFDGVSGSSLKAHQAALEAIKYLQAESETKTDEMVCLLDQIGNQQKI